jgi:hypothetical protein
MKATGRRGYPGRMLACIMAAAIALSAGAAPSAAMAMEESPMGGGDLSYNIFR